MGYFVGRGSIAPRRTVLLFPNSLKVLAHLTGFEPVTPAFGEQGQSRKPA